MTRLIDIAYARSGDKGSSANIGVIARGQEHYDRLCEQLTEERIKEHFSELPVTNVYRYELPNLWALNFVLDGVLGGGGSLSLRLDNQGKALGQALLLMEI